jgi:hypothetical protein
LRNLLKLFFLPSSFFDEKISTPLFLQKQRTTNFQLLLLKKQQQ